MAALDNTLFLNGTTSQAIKSGAGSFYGFIVNSHTNGTIKVWDSTAASGTVILNTITLAAGPGFYLVPMGIAANTGIFVTVGGTLDYTILYA